MTDDNIDVARESRFLILSWLIFSFINLILQLTNELGSSTIQSDQEKIITQAAFATIYIRNMTIPLIVLYFSVI